MPAARWNTIVEENPLAGIGGGPARAPKKGRAVALVPLDGESEEAPRIASNMSELDRVTGGGFVRGSAVLVGGDPGIGKSTILMQVAAALARQNQRVIYVSGEEAIAQVRLRARRLGAADTGVLLAAETNVEDILATLAEGPAPIWLLSIRSRRCGRIRPKPHPARSRRYVPAFRR
nr:ATPase domain-containing protein [Marinicella sp. W31]MDC2876862.1 ATPase domain-containing protein [Marinicella sp. W31]